MLLAGHPAEAVLRLVLEVEQSLELVPGVGSTGCDLLHEVHRVAMVIGAGPLAERVAARCIGRGYGGEDRSRDRRLAF